MREESECDADSGKGKRQASCKKDCFCDDDVAVAHERERDCGRDSGKGKRQAGSVEDGRGVVVATGRELDRVGQIGGGDGEAEALFSSSSRERRYFGKVLGMGAGGVISEEGGSEGSA